jgi:hypothetical protein
MLRLTHKQSLLPRRTWTWDVRWSMVRLQVADPPPQPGGASAAHPLGRSLLNLAQIFSEKHTKYIDSLLDATSPDANCTHIGDAVSSLENAPAGAGSLTLSRHAAMLLRPPSTAIGTFEPQRQIQALRTWSRAMTPRARGPSAIRMRP